MKKHWYVLALTISLLTGTTYVTAQTYVSVPVTGFNQDAVAESGTDLFAVTSVGLDDLLKVLYTKTFAATNTLTGYTGYKGGLPDNGKIGVYQLAPYTGNNILFLSQGGAQPGTVSAGTLTLTTPASYGSLKLLGLSTQQNSTFKAVLNFTDGTSQTVNNLQFLDWFFNAVPNIVTQGFGRIARPLVSTPGGPVGGYVVEGITTSDSASNDPRMYELTIPVTCANQAKLIKTIDFTYVLNSDLTSRAVIFAVAGGPFIPPAFTMSSSPDGCGNAAGVHTGTATVTIPPGSTYTYKWSTIPVQTNPTATGLAPGRDSVVLTDANGCKITSPAVVIAPGTPPIPPVIASLDTCQGFTVTLKVANPGTDTTYKWYSASTAGTLLNTGNTYSVSYAGTSPLNYYVDGTITNATSCVSAGRTPVSVAFESVLSQPIVTVGSSTPASVTFQWTAVPGATGYLVSVNGGAYQTPSSSATGTSHTVTGTTGANISISVIAVGKLACQASIPGTATYIIPSGNVFVPNAFTPNGDGINDILFVYGNFIQTLDMKIFNQWGQSIFETSNKANGWDGTFKGKMQPSGTYMYALKAVLQDGTVVNKKGSINLVH